MPRHSRSHLHRGDELIKSGLFLTSASRRGHGSEIFFAECLQAGFRLPLNDQPNEQGQRLKARQGQSPLALSGKGRGRLHEVVAACVMRDRSYGIPTTVVETSEVTHP